MRRSSVILLAAVALVLIAGRAAGAQIPSPEEYFTPEEIERAEIFRGRAYVLGFTATGLALATAAALGLGRGSRRLAGWARRRFRRRGTRIIALSVIVVLVPGIVQFPLLAGRHRHASRFGLATNEPAEFAADVARAAGFELVIFLVLAAVVLWVARRLPRAWVIVAAPAAAAITAALVFLSPLVYEPAFNTFTPVDAATRERVVEIAARASIDVDEVVVADASRRTTALNAYVSGLGSTKRVVLFDTLLAEATPREIDAVVAHELAHEVHHDLLRGTGTAAAGVAGGVILMWVLLSSGRFRRWIGAEAPGDPAVIPFVAFFIVVAALVTAPAANALSRIAEERADRTALQLTDDAGGMIELQVRLARQNIADLSPPEPIRWAFFSHPPTMERIAIALEARGR